MVGASSNGGIGGPCLAAFYRGYSNSEKQARKFDLRRAITTRSCRDFAHDFGFLEIADSFRHEAADGRQFLVLHGDRFDDVELRAQWLSYIGSFAYDTLIWVNGQVNGVRGMLRLEPRQFTPASSNA